MKQGQILEVSITPLGGELVSDFASGGTVLYMSDIADFAEDGGYLYVEEEVHVYVSSDDEANTVTLASPLAMTLPAETQIHVYPLAGEKWALVELEQDEEAISALVPHALYDQLDDGVRNVEDQEIVNVKMEDGDWVIVNILAQEPLRDQELVDQVDDIDTILDDLNENILPQLQQDLATLNDVTLPALQDDLAQANLDLAALDGKFPITSVNISNDAITAPKISANAVTADKIVANAITADKIVANAVSADKLAANSVSADKIVANAVGADKIAANSIGADKIAANAVTAGKIAAGAVTAGTIAAGAVTTGTMAANSIDASVIAADTLSVSKISKSLDSGAYKIIFTDPVKAPYFQTPGDVTAGNGIYVTGGGFILGSPELGGTVTFSGTSNPVKINNLPDSATGSDVLINGATGILRANFSSRRYKDDIQDLQLDVEDLLEVVPVKYIRKNEPDQGYEYGFIAEQAEEVGATNWVSYDEEGLPQSFCYSRWVVALQAIVRDQQNRITSQQRDIHQLRVLVGALMFAVFISLLLSATCLLGAEI